MTEDNYLSKIMKDFAYKLAEAEEAALTEFINHIQKELELSDFELAAYYVRRYFTLRVEHDGSKFSLILEWKPVEQLLEEGEHLSEEDKILEKKLEDEILWKKK